MSCFRDNWSKRQRKQSQNFQPEAVREGAEQNSGVFSHTEARGTKIIVAVINIFVTNDLSFPSLHMLLLLTFCKNTATRVLIKHSSSDILFYYSIGHVKVFLLFIYQEHAKLSSLFLYNDGYDL